MHNVEGSPQGTVHAPVPGTVNAQLVLLGNGSVSKRAQAFKVVIMAVSTPRLHFLETEVSLKVYSC
jgi:hypothetical protein